MTDGSAWPERKTRETIDSELRLLAPFAECAGAALFIGPVDELLDERSELTGT